MTITKRSLFKSQLRLIKRASLLGFKNNSSFNDENYDKGSRNTAAVAPMEMIRGDSNLLMGR